jgi:hypothetical protein
MTAHEPVIIEVRSGTFCCDTCGARWVGTWRGPVEKMTCRWCDAPMRVGFVRGVYTMTAGGVPAGESET